MSEKTKVATKTPEPTNSTQATRTQTPKAPRNQPVNSPIDHIVHLQRTIGNQAVQRLFQSGVIQTKLKVGKSNDKYEQEADRVAERVMDMPVSKAHGAERMAQSKEQSAWRTCPTMFSGRVAHGKESVQKQEDEEETVQEKPLIRLQEEKEDDEVQKKSLVSGHLSVVGKKESDDDEVQKEAKDDEEAQTKPLIQREDKNDDEETQAKPLIQRESEEDEVQKQSLVSSQQSAVEKEEKDEEVKKQGEKDEDEESVQAKGANAGHQEMPSSTEADIKNIRAGGQPLSNDTRAFFEPRFGRDFSGVRVHTDARSGAASQSIKARAFTLGRDIVFGPGQYAPEKTEGRRLLAHELTHVVQQDSGRSLKRAEIIRRWHPHTQNDSKNLPLSPIPPLEKGGRGGVSKNRNGVIVNKNFQDDIKPSPLAQCQDKENEEDKENTVQKQPVNVSEKGHSQVMRGGFWDDPLSSIGGGLKKLGSGIAKGISEGAGFLIKKAKAYIAKNAKSIPGYELVTHLLGRDPITGKPASKKSGGLLRIIFTFLNAQETYDNLVKSKVFGKAYRILKWSLKRAKLTWGFIMGFVKKMWAFVKSNPFNYVKALIMVKEFFFSLFNKALKVGKSLLYKLPPLILEGFLIIVGAPVKTIMGIINKGKKTILYIAKDPMRFVGNLINALKKGFFQFKDNIWKHLKAGLMGWLFGTMQKAGISIPAKFDLKGILFLILQILRLTYQDIRQRVVKKLGPRGETIVSFMEKGVAFVHALVTKGPLALWEKLKESMASIKEAVIGAVRNWVITKVITAAVTKLATMFNPVGAIIQAAMGIYNTIMFFIERAQQIADLVNAVFNSITSIAYGKIKTAANWIEKTMARTIPVIISFLARLLGLGGIAKKIQDIIKKIRKPIDKAVDKIITWIVKKAKKLLGKGKNTRAGNLSPKEKKKRAKTDFMKKVRAQKGLAKPGMLKLLSSLKTKYKLKKAQITGKVNNAKVEFSASASEFIPLEIPLGPKSGQKEGSEANKAVSKGDYIKATHADGVIPTPAKEIQDYFNSTFKDKPIPKSRDIVPHLNLKDIPLKANSGGSHMRAGRVEAQSSVRRGRGRSGTGETIFGHFGADEEKIKTGKSTVSYNGGHLVGDQIMDSKKSFNLYEGWNLAPQARELNSPTYSGAIEGPVTQAIIAGATIKYDVVVKYPDKKYQVKPAVLLQYLWPESNPYRAKVQKLIKDNMALQKAFYLTRRTPSQWQATAEVIKGNVTIAGGARTRKKVSYGVGGNEPVKFFLEVDKGTGNQPVAKPTEGGNKVKYKGAKKVTFSATQKTF